MAGFLLDTHVLFQLFGEQPKPFPRMEELFEAALDRQLFVSPISAWEIGLLANLQTGRELGFSLAPDAWLELLITRANLQILPLSLKAAILSSRLPGEFHKDPADRLLVASAMHANPTFVTRDTKILTWAERTRALTVLAC